MNHVLRPFLHRRFRILTPLTVLCYVASKIPVDHFVLDLLDHLQSYYLLWFAITPLLAMKYFKDKKLALLSGFFLAVSLPVTFFPLKNIATFSYGKSEGSSVRIVSMNIFYGNNSYHDIESMLLEESPDILAIAELTPEQHKIMGAFLESHFPYRFVKSMDGPAGLALYSRFPISNARFLDPAKDGFGSIAASMLINDKNYNLFVVHPVPPIPQGGFENRNMVFRDLPLKLVDKSADNIVLGDFNNTLWSPYFQALMQSLDVKVNLLTSATWPALPFIPQIGIDHILIPQSARFISIRRGADIGSDHYPLVADIVL